MGIQIGGGSFDVSPFLQLQRQQQMDLQAAQDRADALNMQSAQHTASVGAANFAFHDQQQHEQEALARQQTALARQQQQQDFENQRQAQNDKLAQQNHADQMAHQNALMAQQQQFHGESLAQGEQLRNDSLAERTQRDNTNAGIRDDAESRRLAENEAAPYLKQYEISLHEASRLRLSGATADADLAQSHADLMQAKAKEAHDSVMKSREPWNTPEPPAIELLNPQFALPSSEPQFNTATSEPASGVTSPDASVIGDFPPSGQPDFSPPPQMGGQVGSQMAQRRFDVAQAKAAKIKADADKEARIKANQDRNFGNKVDQQNLDRDTLALEEQAQKWLPSASPFLQYAFAKASATPLPQGMNPLQDAEMAQLGAQAKAQPDLMGNVKTAEQLWDQRYRPQHNPRRMKAILDKMQGLAAPDATDDFPSDPVTPAPQTAPMPVSTSPQPPSGPTSAAPGAEPVSVPAFTRPEIARRQRDQEISLMPRQTPDDRNRHDFAQLAHSASPEKLRDLYADTDANSWEHATVVAELRTRDQEKTPKPQSKAAPAEPFFDHAYPPPTGKPTNDFKNVDWNWMENNGTPEDRAYWQEQHAVYNQGGQPWTRQDFDRNHGAAQPAPAPTGPKRIRNAADFAALKSGETFIDPVGVPRRKP